MNESREIYGIDFSGAQESGSKIWFAKGVPYGKGLVIKECSSVNDLTNSGEGIEECLPALVDLIEGNPNAVFGFDFPFGLPAPLVKEKNWKEFLLGFLKRYKSPEEVREACRQKNPGSELKRKTDTEARTPFSPYNLRLFKQTYYGISRVLYPLVHDECACILPFQEAVLGKPWILEVCPASTLKRLMKEGVPSYKGSGEDKKGNRQQILSLVKKEGVVFEKSAALEEKIIANTGGDAIDSVIAAMAAFTAVQNKAALIPKDDGYWQIEGYVYV